MIVLPGESILAGLGVEGLTSGSFLKRNWLVGCSLACANGESFNLIVFAKTVAFASSREHSTAEQALEEPLPVAPALPDRSGTPQLLTLRLEFKCDTL